MTLIDELRSSEERLSTADIAYYRQVCREDAVFMMPGMVATLEDAIAGLEQSPPWDDFTVSDVRLRMLGTDAAAIIYRFNGRRGDSTYTADMVSTYERDTSADDRPQWRLVIHQQTPHM